MLLESVKVWWLQYLTAKNKMSLWLIHFTIVMKQHYYFCSYSYVYIHLFLFLDSECYAYDFDCLGKIGRDFGLPIPQSQSRYPRQQGQTPRQLPSYNWNTNTKKLSWICKAYVESDKIKTNYKRH